MCKCLLIKCNIKVVNSYNHEHSTSCHILPTGDHHEYFAIDANGLVTVQNGALLDREALATVVLRVVATDKAPENNRHQSSIPVSWSARLYVYVYIPHFLFVVCPLELPQGHRVEESLSILIKPFPFIKIFLCSSCLCLGYVLLEYTLAVYICILILYFSSSTSPLWTPMTTPLCSAKSPIQQVL